MPSRSRRHPSRQAGADTPPCVPAPAPGGTAGKTVGAPRRSRRTAPGCSQPKPFSLSPAAAPCPARRRRRRRRARRALCPRSAPRALRGPPDVAARARRRAGGRALALGVAVRARGVARRGGTGPRAAAASGGLARAAPSGRHLRRAVLRPRRARVAARGVSSAPPRRESLDDSISQEILSIIRHSLGEEEWSGGQRRPQPRTRRQRR